MKSYLPLILGMALVTYLPRVIPLMALSNKKANRKLREFLYYIPYTSLSILIIRGIITAESGMKIPTLAGILTAGILSYKKGNLILSILMGILVSFLIINI